MRGQTTQEARLTGYNAARSELHAKLLSMEEECQNLFKIEGRSASSYMARKEIEGAMDFIRDALSQLQLPYEE